MCSQQTSTVLVNITFTSCSTVTFFHNLQCIRMNDRINFLFYFCQVKSILLSIKSQTKQEHITRTNLYRVFHQMIHQILEGRHSWNFQEYLYTVLL